MTIPADETAIVRPTALAGIGLAAVVVLALVGAVGAGYVPLPVGQWQAMMPFAMASGCPTPPAETWDSLWWDGVAQFYTWRWVLGDALRDGEIPLWSPWSFCGQPFAANGQSACFYPPVVILCGLLPAWKAMGWLWVFHVALALLLTWGLTRRLGGGHLAGVVAGVVYATGGFMLAWTPVASLMQSAAWLPGALWAVEAALHERRWLGGAALAGCLAAAVLAGHMQVAGYVWLTTAGWATLRLVVRAVRHKGAPAGPILAGFALAAALAAPQWLPTAELGRMSPRGLQKPSPEGFVMAQALALRPIHLASLVWPTALGSPKTGNYHGYAFAEHFCGLGPVALVLAIVALVRRPSKWVWALAAMAALAGWAASGGPLGRALYFGLPWLGQAGGFQRLLFVFCLAVAVLAGLGAGALAGEAPAGVAGHRTRPAVAAAVAIAVAVEALALAWAILPFGRGSALERADDVSQWLRGRTDTSARVLAVTLRAEWRLKPRPDALYPPNTMVPRRLMDLQGYDSLYPAVCKATLARIEGTDPSPVANGNMVLIENAGAPAVGEMGVKYVVTQRPIGSVLLKKVAEFTDGARTVHVYQHRAFQPRWRAVCNDGSFRPLQARARYNSVRLIVGPGAAAELTLADTPYPGWRAYVDGRPAKWRPAGARVLGRRLSLPASDRRITVDFVFWPGTVAVGTFAGLVGLCLIAAAWMLWRDRRWS